MPTFYSHGKLLLTGEYVVLDGALSLAIPTQKGQSLIVETIDQPVIIWRSIDVSGTVWFEDSLELKHLGATQGKNNISNTLIRILKAAKRLNPGFLSSNQGYKIITALEFPRDWGLGSSSTLINNIANWAKVDAYKLLEATFGGSGYDIACAKHDKPITYQLKKPFDDAQEDIRRVEEVVFNPKFLEHLYFIHLNKKQNSREGIAHYKAKRTHLKQAISKISAITKLSIQCESFVAFKGLIDRHELIISRLIQVPPVKKQLFNDFNGSIKSLGAWGGDFVLAITTEDPSNYFKAKGYDTVIPYRDMIL